MKNEIGRKITSLTIMAVMFAGGMTVAAPGLMPEAIADFSETDGMLTVSSVYIQGAAIVIPPANIIAIIVRLVNLRPISFFMLLEFL